MTGSKCKVPTPEGKQIIVAVEGNNKQPLDYTRESFPFETRMAIGLQIRIKQYDTPLLGTCDLPVCIPSKRQYNDNLNEIWMSLQHGFCSSVGVVATGGEGICWDIILVIMVVDDCDQIIAGVR